MMLKSVIAAVACAAALVSAKHNVTHYCNPIVSGTLQRFSYNITGGIIPLGVNATKAGELVTRDTKHHPVVVFESCAKVKAIESGAMTTPYSKLSLKEHKGLCVSHNGSSKNHTGELTLQDCEKDVEKVRESQEWNLVYGTEMKGQNATLIAMSTKDEDIHALPLVDQYLPVGAHGHGPPYNITRMTASSTVGYGSLLQIVDPKKEY